MATTITLAFLILVPLVLLIIFLIVILYRYLYKRHINNSLQGKTRGSYIEPIHFIFILLFIILIIFSITLRLRLNNAEDQINNNMNTYYNDLRSQLFSINNRYYDLLDKYQELIDQDKWISYKNYEYLDFTEDKLQVNVKIDFAISTQTPNSTLYLVATTIGDDKDSQKIEILENGLMNYSQTISLNLDKNYRISLIEESENGNIREQMTEIHVKENYTKRIESVTTNVVGDQVEFTIKLDHYNVPNFKLDTINLRFGRYNPDVDQTLYDYTDLVTITEQDHYQIIQGSYQFDEQHDFEILFILEDLFGNKMTTVSYVDINN